MSTEEIPQGADVNIISNKNEKKARELIKRSEERRVGKECRL